MSVEINLLERLVRSLEESADFEPGSAEAKEFGWPARLGYCWCDGAKRHTRACLRARKVQEEAREFLAEAKP